MKAKDLYPYIDDNKKVWIITNTGYPLDRYDGRNSIPEKWGDYEVSSIYGENDYLVIEVDY